MISLGHCEQRCRVGRNTTKFYMDRVLQMLGLMLMMTMLVPAVVLMSGGAIQHGDTGSRVAIIVANAFPVTPFIASPSSRVALLLRTSGRSTYFTTKLALSPRQKTGQNWTWRSININNNCDKNNNQLPYHPRWKSGGTVLLATENEEPDAINVRSKQDDEQTLEDDVVANASSSKRGIRGWLAARWNANDTPNTATATTTNVTDGDTVSEYSTYDKTESNKVVQETIHFDKNNSSPHDNSNGGTNNPASGDTNIKVKNDDPVTRAAQLRAEAERARLEAARMDAELTLQKISRLEKELQRTIQVSKNNGSKSGRSDKDDDTNKDNDDRGKRKEKMEQLQRDIKALQFKLLSEEGQQSKTAQPSIKTATLESISSGNRDNNMKTTAVTSPRTMLGKLSKDGFPGELELYVEPFNEAGFQDTLKYIQDSPGFLLKTLALQVNYEFESVDDINRTELATRFDSMRRCDFSYSTRPKPYFTQQEIDTKVQEIQEAKSSGGWLQAAGSSDVLPKFLQEAAAGNQTKLALFTLEYEYYMADDDLIVDNWDKIVKDEEWLEPVMLAFNKSTMDAAIENLYPPCTRKENSSPSEALMSQFMTQVLPRIPFRSGSKPERVSGGYILRGSPQGETVSGDDIIEAVEKQLAKSSLGDKMTVLYTTDFTIFVEDEDEILAANPDNPFDRSPILYVTGPNLVREPRPVQLSFVTAIGLATTWYLSLYPFLLNPAIAKRVEDELALVDAGMNPDLSWLTESSLPLFTTFMGILLAHELAHTIVAASNKFKISVPTFVPSIITGVTSSVTTFKSLPKNRKAMLDFSCAGPLAGMVTSLVAIALGCQLTTLSDPNTLPALPLEILRQSTLAGGLINNILGNGVLNVPPGAIGTQAIAGMTIPLHPIAIAGYIGLVVNALSMLPIGTTDGGRAAMALLGRASKLAIGQLSLVLLLVMGVLGSDLFLFYFAFLVAFQSGNEVPARNEVDKVDFARVILASVTLIMAILSLVPFQ